MDQETQDLLVFFSWGHLPPRLQTTSRRFADLAFLIAEDMPAGRERIKALDLLLAAKDAAVRCVVEADRKAKAATDAE